MTARTLSHVVGAVLFTGATMALVFRPAPRMAWIDVDFVNADVDHISSECPGQYRISDAKTLEQVAACTKELGYPERSELNDSTAVAGYTVLGIAHLKLSIGYDDGTVDSVLVIHDRWRVNRSSQFPLSGDVYATLRDSIAAQYGECEITTALTEASESTWNAMP